MKYDELSKFAKAYVRTMLWAETDNSDDSGGDPLDNNYDHTQLAPETVARIHEDCSKFAEKNEHLWEDDDDAGHDFWLTRRGHGAGFWDKPEVYGKENAEELTKASKAFGDINIYVGDDDMLYFL